MKQRLSKLKTFLKTHERILLPTTMLVGFIVDWFTLNRADQIFDNVILLTHLLIIGGSIFVLFVKPKPFIPYLMQYSFGNLFSGMIALYIKSGTLLTSFPFFLTLLVLLISNEFIHKKWPWLTIQISLFFVALLSYTTVITPVLFREINTFIFILGTIFALIIIGLYIILLTKVLPDVFEKHRKNIIRSLTIIFISFNILYFVNVIPPVPLSLKDGGIFHSVSRNASGDYIALGERQEWYRPFKDYNSTFNHIPGESVYAFSSIFVPIKITETIYHKWYSFDSAKSRWTLETSVPIQISGGRDEGYRGWSQKSSITPGLWRVDVTNTKGQIIARLKFKVVSADSKPELIERIY